MALDRELCRQQSCKDGEITQPLQQPSKEAIKVAMNVNAGVKSHVPYTSFYAPFISARVEFLVCSQLHHFSP